MHVYVVMESPWYYPQPGTGDWRYAGTSLRAAEAEFDVLVAKRTREALRGWVESAEVFLVRIAPDGAWTTLREATVGSES